MGRKKGEKREKKGRKYAHMKKRFRREQCYFSIIFYIYYYII